MQAYDSDRNLLFGILALQMDFISREQLMAATSAWLLDKSQTLDELLLEQGSLSEADRAILAPLVERHIENHGGDPRQSLAAISSIASVLDELLSLGDADIKQSLAMISDEAQNDGTGEQTVAMPPPENADDPAATNLTRSDATRFQILRPHAQGGLGKVSVANDIELNREVALKEILSQYAGDTESRGRFLLEAEVTGGLEHPGIVPVYGLGQYKDGRPYYAMRFIRGHSLKEAVDRFHQEGSTAEAPHDAERLIQLRKLLGRFIDVCNAIAYAHSRGVLHRDLKPDNIMLGKYGETLVVDWGLAKIAGRDDDIRTENEKRIQPSSGSGVTPTQAGSAFGTPAYMPPEQAEGNLDKLGPVSDIYSLGATLYYIMTGKPPIAGNSLSEVLSNVIRGKIDAPHTIKPGVPKALEAICMKALSREGKDRYQSSRDLANDIERYLADEPVTAHIEPLSVRVRRWIRKHPAPVTAVAVTILVGLVSAVSMTTIVAGKNAELATANARLDDSNNQLTQANTDLEASIEKERTATAEAKQQRDRAVEAETLAKANEQKAKKQEAAAEKSAQESKAVIKFFEDEVLSAARPVNQSGGLGIDATIRAAIDAAEPKIAKSFRDQPLVEASLRNALGLTYWYVGEGERAVIQQKRAKDLREEYLGPKHVDTLNSMNNLAAAYNAAGRLKEALPLYEETLRLRKEELGTEHPDTLTSMSNLAGAYHSAGRLNGAILLYEKTLQLQKKILGPQHPDTLTSAQNLAVVYLSANRVDDALQLLEETLRIIKTKRGPEHPETLYAMGNLASAYFRARRAKEAVPLFEETLRLSKANLGPGHSLVLTSMNNLAYAYFSAGRPAEALPLFEETLRIKRKRLGSNHPDTLATISTLGIVYYSAKRWDDAIPLFEEYLEHLKVKPESEDPKTISAMRWLASSYKSTGRLNDAIPLYEETLRLRKKVLGPMHQDTLSTMSVLAETYLLANQADDALSLYEQYVAILRKKEAANAPRFAGKLVGVSYTLLEQKQYAAAETYLRECLEVYEKSMPNTWKVAIPKSMLGESLRGQKKFAEAEPLLIAGYEEMKKHEKEIPGKLKKTISQTIQRLVDLYTAWEKPEEAVRWNKVLKKNTASSEKK